MTASPSTSAFSMADDPQPSVERVWALLAGSLPLPPSPAAAKVEVRTVMTFFLSFDLSGGVAV